MKTAAQLLNEFLPRARNLKKAAALFAEDGVVELPYLLDLGMQWQYKGRTESSEHRGDSARVLPQWIG
jgi:uncharacterized protein